MFIAVTDCRLGYSRVGGIDLVLSSRIGVLRPHIVMGGVVYFPLMVLMGGVIVSPLVVTVPTILLVVVPSPLVLLVLFPVMVV